MYEPTVRKTKEDDRFCAIKETVQSPHMKTPLS
jgi:hypothetical protein